MGRGGRGGAGPRRDSRRNGLRGRGQDGSRASHGRDRQGRGPHPKGGRRRGGAPRDVICGRRAVAEALAAGVPLRQAYLQARAAGDVAELRGVVDELEARGVPVEEVPLERLDQLTDRGNHQGIAVAAAPFGYASLADVVRAAGAGDALVVVLDHVTDEGNFGAIVRSCEVMGAAGVVVAKSRAARVGVGAYKTSAGAVLHLPIAQVPNVASAVDALKEAGFWCVAATEHAEQPCWDAALDGRVAVVMGSEGSGVSRLVLERCDDACLIPQRGRVESLNVAQAASVLCYEWARRTWGGAES